MWKTWAEADMLSNLDLELSHAHTSSPQHVWLAFGREEKHSLKKRRVAMYTLAP